MACATAILPHAPATARAGIRDPGEKPSHSLPASSRGGIRFSTRTLANTLPPPYNEPSCQEEMGEPPCRDRSHRKESEPGSPARIQNPPVGFMRTRLERWR